MLWPLSQAKFYRVALALKRLDTPALNQSTKHANLHNIIKTYSVEDEIYFTKKGHLSID